MSNRLWERYLITFCQRAQFFLNSRGERKATVLGTHCTLLLYLTGEKNAFYTSLCGGIRNG